MKMAQPESQQLSKLCAAITLALLIASCGGENGSGTTSGTGPTGGVVSTVIPRYAFVTNDLDSTVARYVVEASTGRLRYIGKADAGSGANGMTLHPSGNYAYAANLNDNTISQYSLGADGSLTPNAAGATVSAGDGPIAFAIHPSGEYA